MSSWFNDALGKLNDISTKVQSSLPIDDDLLGKLTLRSDDLKAIHDLIDTEEKQKEQAIKLLSNLLQWETEDETKVILVEECRASILGLSVIDSTFTTPFALPEGLKMWTEHSGMTESTKEMQEEAMKKFEKIPFPDLLSDFDLNAHVELVQRLFKLDKNLVVAHSKLANAGKTEKVFWKNYFFNCALSRYSKGLDLNEIWNPKRASENDNNSNGTSGDYDFLEDDMNNSIELTFEPEDDATSGSRKSANSTTKTSSVGELIQSPDDLDDLDAEIARELGED